jgi:amino acid adenylation domain-containing protein
MKTDTTNDKKVSYNPFLNGSYDLVVPRTIAQEEMLSSIAMDENASLCYNEVLAINFHGNLNKQAVELAISLIIERHDALRMTFSRDGKAMLLKSKSDHKLRYMSGVDLEKIKQDEVLTPFDLFNGPCVRSVLVEMDPQFYVLIFSTHHIICDGWSLAVILSELSQIYNDIVQKKITELETIDTFSTYALNEFHRGVNQTHRQFWKKEFSYPLRTNKFPTDFEREKYRKFKSERIDFIIDTQLVAGLKKLSAKNGTSFYSALVAVFNVLLFKINKSPEQVVGLACAAQPAIDQHSLVGHLVNLLPLRLETAASFTFIQLLKLSKTKMLDAFENHDYSYGLLVKDLTNITRTPGEMPLLNTVFNIDQQSPDQGLSLDNIQSDYQSVPRAFENFEIFINAVSRENTLVLECQYNVELFKKDTIQNWLTNYAILIKSIIQDSDQLIGNINLSSLIVPSLQSNLKEEIKAERFQKFEVQIIETWKEVLGINNISSTDNFFSIGGHSLLAIEVAAKLTEKFRLSITIKDIFEYDDVQSLASKIATTLPNTKSLELPPIIPAMINRLVPVTNNQMQVWYLEEMFAGTTMHNLPSAIRLKTKVDKKILEKAFDTLIQRHDVLKTAIIVEDGVPVQKMLEVDATKIEVERATLETIVSKLNIDAKFVFDKKRPPLFRVKLYKLADDDYVLFFMVHHAIWDGWSFDIFFEELNIAYSTIHSSGNAVFETSPTMRYADYSAWMSELISAKLLDNQFQYWKDKLAGPLPVMDLPTDYKRALVINHEGEVIPFTLTSEQSLKLRNFAKSKNNSVFNVLLTIFKEVLANYSGLEDIIVGAPVRGRVRPEMLSTIGYFVNAVALRSKISKDQSFDQKLKVVTTTCLEAFENQLLPFQLVLNSVAHDRDSSRTPIFQTFFSYQDVNNRRGEFNGVPYSQINIDKASTHTDLDLWIKANDKKIEGAFEYRKDIFKEITIARFAECFLACIDNLGSANVFTLPEAQENLLLKTWNNTQDLTIKNIPFIFDFIQMANLYPTKMAVQTSSEQLTYSELNLLSTRFANMLLNAGVGNDDLVGISMSRTPMLLVAILGSIKAGAGYVPLDPAFPQDRLNYMVESAAPKVLITEEKISPRFKQNIQKILMSEIGNDETPINPSVVANNTAYVIYTSGSTGNPKGVELTHSSVTNFLHGVKNLGLITSEDKILAVTTLSFDIAVLELLLPLISGASIYLASSSEVVDGATLKIILENKNISMIQATPSTYKLLLNAGWKGGKHLRLLCGGEAFPLDLAQTLIPMTKEVWNMYGPTETTVWSTCKKLNLVDLKLTIGTPIANTDIYILDNDFKLVPIGSTGQLFIGGRGLAKGYFNRPDLTAERFVINPFNKEVLIYATGDMARYTFDGEIECLGRNDGQVKVRGYRIELGEIELQLKNLNSISDAVVVTSEFRSGDVRIVAYVTSSNFNEVQTRAQLTQNLPNYMIPNHFVLLSEIPKTLNGKVDKKQLPQFKETVTSVTESKLIYNASTGLEQELRSIWQNVLAKAEIQDSDNFFDIGGNSLLAVQIFAKLAAIYKLNLPLSVLIEAKDFRSFAAIIIDASTPKEKQIAKTNKLNATSSIVTISSQGNLAPLFCFHGVGGNVLNYVSLIPALRSKRALLAVESAGLHGDSRPHDSIQKMAIAYIKDIKEVQPVGPYLLAGGSMGGLIAFEVASRLKAAGDEIEQLIMFDTFGPNLDLKKYSSNKNQNYFSEKWFSFKYQVKVKLTELVVRFCDVFKIQIPLTTRLFEVESKNYQALWKYKANSYDGDIDIIRSQLTSEGWYSDLNMGWKGIVTGKIKTHQINGSHEGFIESPELIGTLANIIN